MNDVPAHIQRGRQTRQRVLSHTVRIATIEGLEALTIGRVAQVNALTKAGLLGHFKSKEELQIATLEAGRNQFIDVVVAPALQKPPGNERLGFALAKWLRYITASEGGCFFASVAAEFDARTGPVRDRIAALLQEWIAGLTQMIEASKQEGHIPARVDASQMAFELHGHELSLNLRLQLLGASDAIALASHAMQTTVLSMSTPSGRSAFIQGWEIEP